MADIIPIRDRMAAIANPPKAEPDPVSVANERAADAEILFKAESAARLEVEGRLAAALAARAVSDATAQRERDARVAAETLLAAANTRVAELESRPVPEPVRVEVPVERVVHQPEPGALGRIERLIAGLMPQRKLQPQLSHFDVIRHEITGKAIRYVPVMKEETTDGV